jgi:hypothetical protein
MTFKPLIAEHGHDIADVDHNGVQDTSIEAEFLTRPAQGPASPIKNAMSTAVSPFQDKPISVLSGATDNSGA